MRLYFLIKLFAEFNVIIYSVKQLNLRNMICTILGCGGSSGVPEIGCGCFTCSSPNPKNKRLRSSIYIQSKTTSILVDTSPDLRQQALTHGIKYLDAILYTHDHGDHICGIDDTKSFARSGCIIPTFLNQSTYDTLTQRFPYIFKQASLLYPVRLQTNILKYNHAFQVGDIDIISFPQIHGKIISTGFRFGELAYSTDLNELTNQAIEVLAGVQIWIVDCLRYAWAPTHSYLERTISWSDKIKPELTILTHMAHDIEYAEIKKILPQNIIPAFDGLKINFNQ
ncbi:MAG: MBL fold metallo-hydrolase [Candidatus Midichloria sp.]|nr:MAG: MBL fold metallo-hydrolase [Candidatus Midichloria sp.]